MTDTKPVVVEEKDNDEDKSEVLGNLVKVVVLIWSASLLTFSHVRLPNGQKILDFDPTFIASVFSGSCTAFGLSPAKNGSAPKKAPSIGKKEEQKMQKIINALAVLSFVGVVGIVGGGHLCLSKQRSTR